MKSIYVLEAHQLYLKSTVVNVSHIFKILPLEVRVKTCLIATSLVQSLVPQSKQVRTARAVSRPVFVQTMI